MAYLLTGFDFARIGTHTLAGTDETGAVSASYTAGTYAHRDLSSVMGTGEHIGLAAQLTTDLNATNPGAGDFLVEWAAATGYTISYDNGNFTLTFTGSTAATNMGALLGFSADQSGADTYTSTRTPYYYLALEKLGPSEYTDDYEANGGFRKAYVSSGRGYGTGPLSVPTFTEIELSFETLAKVFSRRASATVPWTFQHMVQHCRTWEPILYSYSVEDTVLELREESASFDETFRRRVWTDNDSRWHVRIACDVRGRL